MKTVLLILCLMVLSGCTVVRHHEKRADQTSTTDWFISVGASRTIKKLKYRSFELEQLSSDEAKGLGTASEGIVKGFTRP